MKVTIPVEFFVVPSNCEDELTIREAELAAEQACFDYLSFVKISGYSTDSDEVEVHVMGFGNCIVTLSE